METMNRWSDEDHHHIEEFHQDFYTLSDVRDKLLFIVYFQSYHIQKFYQNGLRNPRHSRMKQFVTFSLKMLNGFIIVKQSICILFLGANTFCHSLPGPFSQCEIDIVQYNAVWSLFAVVAAVPKNSFAAFCLWGLGTTSSNCGCSMPIPQALVTTSELFILLYIGILLDLQEMGF